ncbi:MAG: hypothetical protein HY696_09755 [Deltaproteobacteria bacterium]|nr:hypothetical protein [Deltaproteobacteria bacterium]
MTHRADLIRYLSVLGSALLITACGSDQGPNAANPSNACVPAGTLINGECNETPTGASGDGAGTGTAGDNSGAAGETPTETTEPTALLATKGMSMAVVWTETTENGKRVESLSVASVRVAGPAGVRTERMYMLDEPVAQITAATRFAKAGDTQYDAQGRIIALIGYGDCAATWKSGVTFRMSYNAQGRLARSSMEQYQSYGATAGDYQGKSESTYTYNSAGKVASATTMMFDENGTKLGSGVVTYQYTATGRIMTTTNYLADGTPLGSPTTTSLEGLGTDYQATITEAPRTTTLFENGQQTGKCRYPTVTDAIIVGTCTYQGFQSDHIERGWFVGLSDDESDARQSQYGNICSRPVTDFLGDLPADFRTAE